MIINIFLIKNEFSTSDVQVNFYCLLIKIYTNKLHIQSFQVGGLTLFKFKGEGGGLTLGPSPLSKKLIFTIAKRGGGSGKESGRKRWN